MSGSSHECSGCTHCEWIDVIRRDSRDRLRAGRWRRLWTNNTVDEGYTYLGQHTERTIGCDLIWYQADVANNSLKATSRRRGTGSNIIELWNVGGLGSFDSTIITNKSVDGKFCIHQEQYLQLRSVADGSVTYAGALGDSDYNLLRAYPFGEGRVVTCEAGISGLAPDEAYVRFREHSGSTWDLVGDSIYINILEGTNGTFTDPGPNVAILSGILYFAADGYLCATTTAVAADVVQLVELPLQSGFVSAHCGKVYVVAQPSPSITAVHVLRYDPVSEEVDTFALASPQFLSTPDTAYVVRDTFPGGDDDCPEDCLNDEGTGGDCLSCPHEPGTVANDDAFDIAFGTPNCFGQVEVTITPKEGSPPCVGACGPLVPANTVNWKITDDPDCDAPGEPGPGESGTAVCGEPFLLQLPAIEYDEEENPILKYMCVGATDECGVIIAGSTPIDSFDCPLELSISLGGSPPGEECDDVILTIPPSGCAPSGISGSPSGPCPDGYGGIYHGWVHVEASTSCPDLDLCGSIDLAEFFNGWFTWCGPEICYEDDGTFHLWRCYTYVAPNYVGEDCGPNMLLYYFRAEATLEAEPGGGGCSKLAYALGERGGGVPPFDWE